MSLTKGFLFPEDLRFLSPVAVGCQIAGSLAAAFGRDPYGRHRDEELPGHADIPACKTRFGSSIALHGHIHKYESIHTHTHIYTHIVLFMPLSVCNLHTHAHTPLSILHLLYLY